MLLVANHVSWLDIIAIHAACPQARFVSKADVRHWPLSAGWWTRPARSTWSASASATRCEWCTRWPRRCRAGDTVAIFPEGTTADGRTLLPFHANLLQAAVATGTPVQPVALRFSDRHQHVSPSAEFLGETTLAESLWRLACGDGMGVHVTLLPPRATAHADRRALAQMLRGDIAAALEPRPGV